MLSARPCILPTVARRGNGQALFFHLIMQFCRSPSTTIDMGAKDNETCYRPFIPVFLPRASVRTSGGAPLTRAVRAGQIAHANDTNTRYRVHIDRRRTEGRVRMKACACARSVCHSRSPSYRFCASVQSGDDGLKNALRAAFVKTAGKIYSLHWRIASLIVSLLLRKYGIIRHFFRLLKGMVNSYMCLSWYSF